MINCLIVDDEEMSRNMVRHFVEQTEFLNLVGVCQNAIEASSIIHQQKIDLVFLDVEMPEMTGYQFMETFVGHPPQVIIISGKREYAADAFSYDVADFLVKPLTYPRFLKAVTKAREKNTNGNAIVKADDLYVRSDSKIIKVKFEEVLYVEALADYIMIFTADAKHIVHSTMKGFQIRLPQDQFVRVHRSYIVNINKVEAIENLFVVINKKHIPIGASYKEGFMKRLNLL